MPTKAEIKAKATHIKIKIRRGDQVVIIAGKDKGQKGVVAAVYPDKMKAIILQENDENPDMPLPLNAAIKHRKAKYQAEKSARIRIPVPIHISNLMILDPKTGNASRVGRRKDGDKIVRYAKKSGEALNDKLVNEG